MRLVLVSRMDDRRAVDFTADLAVKLQKEGFDAIYLRGTISDREHLGLDPDTDLVVVVGGDGTVLRTIQRMQKQIPVIGLNWGEVGFLADVEPDEAIEFFTRIRTGFSIERRMRISIRSDGKELGDALNEMVIVTSRPAKMLRFRVLVDGVVAEVFRADGVLVSTPTGSTAYAMSAGGPIVDPKVEAFLLVPLAPYMLSSRPWLISCERRFQIQLEGPKPARLVLDGQRVWNLKGGETLVLERSAEPALFVDVGRGFFEKVNKKLRNL
ncbi:MAG: NAD(+)/NADH kinase [Methanomicrobiales archaeon]|nr:NAD(+)/NADH kinase [Methanomicrobiales archaeon]